MARSSAKKRSEVETKVEAMFSSREPSTVPLPDMGRFSSIVERTFAIDDPDAMFDTLEAALDRRDALTPGVLREALAAAPSLYRDASRLYVVARFELERFDARREALEANMRDQATRDLQREKDQGDRSKAITDKDVVARMSEMFPDHYQQLREDGVKARKMVDHLSKMVDVFKARVFALGALNGTKENL